MSKLNRQNNIKELYSLIEDKKEFVIEISKAFGRKPNSVSNHWFSGYFSVPSAKEDEVISFMQKYIAKQNNVPVNPLQNEA